MGIGVTPTQKLEVAGATYIHDASGAQNNTTLNVLNTCTSGNTFGAQIQSSSSSSQNLALYLQASGGSGSINYAMQIFSLGAASINTGIYASVSGAGTNYGIRIVNPPAGANNYAIYSDAAAQSYFAGNVGIGSSSIAVSRLEVSGPSTPASITAFNQIFTVTAGASGNGQQLQIGAANASPWYTWIQGSYNTNAGFASTIVIQPLGGPLGIGTLSPSHALELGSDSAAKPATSTWTISSDGRLKRNVRPLEGGLPVITALRAIEAEYNGLGGTKEGQRVVGFLAEEIRKILPHTVGTYRGKLREDDAEETELSDFNLHEVLLHLVVAVQQLAARDIPRTS